jgi:hypothetical protein
MVPQGAKARRAFRPSNRNRLVEPSPSIESLGRSGASPYQVPRAESLRPFRTALGM